MSEAARARETELFNSRLGLYLPAKLLSRQLIPGAHEIPLNTDRVMIDIYADRERDNQMIRRTWVSVLLMLLSDNSETSDENAILTFLDY